MGQAVYVMRETELMFQENYFSAEWQKKEINQGCGCKENRKIENLLISQGYCYG